MKCLECSKELKIINALHLKSHNMTCKEYEDKYNVKIISWNNKLTKETDNRVLKNGLSTSKTRKILFNSGELIQWNKGETKETNPSVAKYGETARKNKKHKKPNIKNHNNMLGKKMSKHVVKKRTKTWLKNYAHGKIILAFNQYKAFYREDIQMYVRSTWEANFVRILNLLNITFEYEKYKFKLKNGRVYTPDFKINNVFYEIKGYWRKNAKRKFNMFKKQNPNIKIKVIGSRFYYKLEKRFKHKISNWE